VFQQLHQQFQQQQQVQEIAFHHQQQSQELAFQRQQQLFTNLQLGHLVQNSDVLRHCFGL
jgi:hypothetical protein